MTHRPTLLFTAFGLLIGQCRGAAIPIGLVIESNHLTEISAVTYAVQFANANILTADSLILNIYASDPNSTVDSIQKTCMLITAGCVAQIGPASSTHVAAVAAYLEKINIPLMAPVATSPSLSSFNYIMHMVPSDVEQGRVVASIMTKMVWSRVHILSSDDEYGVFGLTSFIEIASNKGWHIASMRSFQSNVASPNVSTQLDLIRHSGYRLTILNCLDWQAKYILQEAKAKNMTGQGWLWIVTDGSTNSGNFLPTPLVPDFMLGILGTGFPAASGGLAAQFQANWAGLDPLVYPGAGTSTITTSIARWADSVFAVAYAIRDYGGAVTIPTGLSCFGGATHPFGPTLLSEIQKVVQPGVAQTIDFTMTYPTSTLYEIYNTRSTGWVKVATWDPVSQYQKVGTEAINLPGNLPATPDFISAINGAHFVTVTVPDEPFWFFPNGTQPADLNNIKAGTEMIGYGIELTLEMARILNFTFEMYLVPDGSWGGKNTTSGEWNGMVKELLAKNAVFAFASFTINNIRAREIDFSTPYIDVGLKVAIPKDSVASSDWEFMLPLHAHVWYAIGISMVTVGVVVAFAEKISPYGFQGEFVYTYHDMDKIKPFRRDRKLFRRHRHEAMTVMRTDNSIWFSMASLIQQGYERQPQALSSRVVSMLWWFAVLAIISTYTAQLGAVLISSRLQGQINTVAELYAQTKIQYGYGRASSIEQFFCGNELSLYKNMCLQVRKWNSLTSNTDEAILRLADPNDKFAFIWDSPIIDSITEKQPCNIRQLDEIFNRGGWGLGMQKGSQYNEIMSQTILQLRENSFIDGLYNKWFTQRTECAAENRVLSDTEKNQKGVKDLKGIFYIFILAAMISPVLIVIEFTYSCFEHQQKMRNAGIFMSLCAVIGYRLGRMGRDFAIYTVPEGWKKSMGLHEYTRQRQHELWQINSQEHRAAQLEVDQHEYQDHYRQF